MPYGIRSETRSLSLLQFEEERLTDDAGAGHGGLEVLGFAKGAGAIQIGELKKDDDVARVLDPPQEVEFRETGLGAGRSVAVVNDFPGIKIPDGVAEEEFGHAEFYVSGGGDVKFPVNRIKRCVHQFWRAKRDVGRYDGHLPERADMKFFLIINTEQVGPITLGEMMEMWKLGQINSATFYWREGMSDWLPLGPLVSDAIAAAENVPPPPKAEAPPAASLAVAPQVPPPVIETVTPVTKASETTVMTKAPPIVTEDAPEASALVKGRKPGRRGATWVEWVIVLIFVVCIVLLLIYA
jgi:GYF domain 2